MVEMHVADRRKRRQGGASLGEGSLIGVAREVREESGRIVARKEDEREEVYLRTFSSSVLT